MAEEIQKHGGEIRTKQRLKEIVLNKDDTVKHFLMQDGSQIEGDLYVSAMPGGLFCLTGDYNFLHCMALALRFDQYLRYCVLLAALSIICNHHFHKHSLARTKE